MRWVLLSLMGIGLLLPACSADRGTNGSDAQLYREAFRPSWGGATQQGFRYGGRHFLVVFQCHTSGVATSEPFVFVQTTNGWHCIYHHITERFAMDATVEGHTLLLRRMEWPGGKLRCSQYWSCDLGHFSARNGLGYFTH